MINDPFHPEEAIARERDSNKRKLLAVVCAVALTAILLVGYGLIRRYHAQKVLAENTPPPVVDNGPKGPALAHIVLDEPSIAKGMTTETQVYELIEQYGCESDQGMAPAS